MSGLQLIVYHNHTVFYCTLFCEDLAFCVLHVGLPHREFESIDHEAHNSSILTGLASSNQEKIDDKCESVCLYIIQNLRQTSFITHGPLAPLLIFLFYRNVDINRISFIIYFCSASHIRLVKPAMFSFSKFKYNSITHQGH